MRKKSINNKMNNVIILPKLEIIEVWDKNPSQNKGRYLNEFGREADFVVMRKLWTGTEFVLWFLNVKDLKFVWLVRLFSYLNSLKRH